MPLGFLPPPAWQPPAPLEVQPDCGPCASCRRVDASMVTQLIERSLGRAEGLGLRHRPGPATEPRHPGAANSGGGGSGGGGAEGGGAALHQQRLPGSGAAAVRDAQVRWASRVSGLIWVWRVHLCHHGWASHCHCTVSKRQHTRRDESIWMALGDRFTSGEAFQPEPFRDHAAAPLTSSCLPSHEFQERPIPLDGPLPHFQPGRLIQSRPAGA